MRSLSAPISHRLFSRPLRGRVKPGIGGKGVIVGDGEPPDEDIPLPDGVLPAADNTGPRIDDDFTPTGPFTTEFDDQVIERMEVTGDLLINHDGVIVKDCKFVSENWCIKVHPNVTRRATIIFCSFDGNMAGGMAIQGGNADIARCYFTGFSDGIVPDYGECDITYNCMEGFGGPFGAHPDMIELNGQMVAKDQLANVYIYRNVLDMSNLTATNAINMNNSAGPIDDVLIEYNVIRGGSYTVAVNDFSGQGGAPPGITNINLNHNIIEEGDSGMLDFRSDFGLVVFMDANKDYNSGAYLANQSEEIDEGELIFFPSSDISSGGEDNNAEISLRAVITLDADTQGADLIVEFGAANTLGWIVQNASIGVWAGVDADTVDDPIPLAFNNDANPGFEIRQGEYIYSGRVNLGNLSAGTKVVVIADVPNTSQGGTLASNGNTNITTYFRSGAGFASYNLKTVAGLSQSANNAFGIKSIQIV